MDWQPGSKIGAYRLERLLGRGGMGEVYLARDERLERQVAIKRVRPDRLDDPAFRARFRREARIVARLNHASIVQIFDLLEDPLGDGGDALVLEWVDGAPLSAVVAEGPLDAGRLVAWGEAIAQGLAAAHAQDLLHRDLKTGNVLVSRGGQVKILDFGLARPVIEEGEQLTADEAVLGTLATMSPEQARGEKLDKSSDLFSLGVLLYEMARGSSPFKAESPYETLRRVQQEDPPPLHLLRPDLPPELCGLIGALLAKDPAARPESAARVADALRRISFAAGESRAEWSGGSDASTWVPSGSTFSWSRRSASPAAPSQAGGSRSSAKGFKLSHSSAARSPATRSSASAFGRPRRRFLALAAALAVLLAAAGLLAQFLAGSGPLARWRAEAPAAAESRLLRVAVPPPQAGDAAASPLLLAGVGVELQRGLLDLAGVVLFDAAQIGELSGGPLEAARAVAADEALGARLFGGDGRLMLMLQRLKAADGSVIWAENLELPEGGDPLLAGAAIRTALRRAYAGLPLRPGSADIRVSAEDYARFVEVRRRFDAARRISQPADLDELEAIGISSPLFADAHVLAATVALGLHRDSKDAAGLLQRARRAVERGLALGSDSPSLYGAAIRLALAEGDDAEAGRLLAKLEAERPGDPSIVDLESRRLESQGRIVEAIALRRRALESGAATWRELYFLADLEYRRGEHREAREHLRAALERAPDNAWALDKLGQIELAYGSLAEAEKIFGALAGKDPRRGYFTNLGLARFLGGRYAEAIEAYGRARGLGGEHYAILLNLADAELARGRESEAKAHYARALEQLAEVEQRAALSAKELTAKAQCLLYLGRRDEAVALVLETLQKYPQEVEIQYHAALVLAGAGERASALACARRALELGYPPRWLEIPAFAGLREDPAFRALLKARDFSRPQ